MKQLEGEVGLTMFIDAELKRQAKRIARTRGRFFEELIKRRISEKLEKITENFD